METADGRITVKYFVGATKDTEWSSVYFYSPQIPAIFEQKGQIFAALSLSSPPSFDSERAGNLLLDELHEHYFESTEESVLTALEKAVLSVKKRLLELLENDEASANAGIEFNLVTMVVKEDYAYIVKMGEGYVYGWREDQLAQLSSALRDPDGKAEIKTGSFVIEANDRFLLLTPQANEELGDLLEVELLEKFSIAPTKGRYFANESLVAFILFAVDLEHPAEKIDGIEEEKLSETEDLDSDEDENLDDEEMEKEDEIYETNVLASEGEESEVDQEEIREQQLSMRSRVSDEPEKLHTSKSIGSYIEHIKNKLNELRKNPNAKTFQVLIMGAFDKLFQLTKQGAGYFWNDMLQMKPGRRTMYLRGGKQQVNWRPFVFFGVVIIIVGYVLFSSLKSRNERKAAELKAENELTRFETEKGKLAERVQVLMNSADHDQEKADAYGQITKAREDISAITLFEERKNSLTDSYNQLETKILRKIIVENPTIIKDLGIAEGTTIPSDIELYKGKIYVSDKGNGIIYTFNLDGAELKRVAENLKQPTSITANEFDELIFVDSDDNRAVGKIKLSDQNANTTPERFPGLSSNTVGNIVELEAYKVNDSDHRLYAVRADKNEVIQQKRVNSDYGFPSIRFDQSEVSNLGKPIGIEINDGRIYLLTQGQGVRRFFGDNEMTLDVKGMLSGDSWKDGSSVFVDEKYIYVGDNVKHRILVFGKGREGDLSKIDFVAQYDLSNIAANAQITDIMSDKASSSLFALVGTKVIKLDLKEIGKWNV